jgi:hypothetical protein
LKSNGPRLIARRRSSAAAGSGYSADLTARTLWPADPRSGLSCDLRVSGRAGGQSTPAHELSEQEEVRLIDHITTGSRHSCEQDASRAVDDDLRARPEV